jgi:hypothetical protein
VKFAFASIAAALGLAPLNAQVTPSVDDARGAIAAVLAHQVSIRGPTGAQDICVAGALTGLPPSPDAEEPAGPERAVHIRFQWHLPESPLAVRPPRVEPEPGEGRRERRERRRLLPERQLPAPLAPDLASELDALRAEASRSTTTPALTAIDAGSIPEPLRVLRQDESCWQLHLSAPAFAGDAAFVAIDYLCGTSCGDGSLYALRRRETHWEVVGVADTWIN